MVTGEMVEELILSGADIVKVGIGPGKCMLISVVYYNGPSVQAQYALLVRRLVLATHN